jgi:hypothetical protein
MKHVSPHPLAQIIEGLLSGRVKAPRSRFPSAGFKFCLLLIPLLFLFAQGQIAAYHLKTEQAWSAELLEQNTHSLEIVGRQKKHISDLYKALQAQHEQLHPEAI